MSFDTNLREYITPPDMHWVCARNVFWKHVPSGMLDEVQPRLLSFSLKLFAGGGTLSFKASWNGVADKKTAETPGREKRRCLHLLLRK